MSPLQRPGEFSGCKFEAVIKPFQSSLFNYPSVVELNKHVMIVMSVPELDVIFVKKN